MPGAVAAGHPLSAEAGARALAAGANAVEACIAAALVAFVAEGPLTGVTGGGFFLIQEPGGPAVLLDCFFAVPERTLGPMEEVLIDFADAGTQSFHVGEGSVAVPGLVPGLVEAHRRYGSGSWAALVEPALALARDGFVRDQARTFLHEILVPILLRTEGGRSVYGDPERVATAALVPTLERLRDAPGAAVAELLPELAGDLDRYRVVVREPLRAHVAGCDVLATPAPSRGGRIVLEILERLDAESDPGPAEVARAVGAAYAAGGAGRLTGTTQVSVVDGEGLAAALSMTLGSGSGVFRGGSQLNNMLGELDVIGPLPSEPGKRLPSMMTPTVVLSGGRPRLVLGSAGSVRLAGAIAQVAWNVVGLGLPLREAVDAPRLHVDGSDLHLEGGRPAEPALSGDGWNLVRWSGRNLFFGGVAAVEVRDGSYAAAGDPRRGGHGVLVP